MSTHELAVRLFDAKHGDGAAQKIIDARNAGRSLADVGTELGVSRQYVSQLYMRLTGQKWSEGAKRVYTPVDNG